jgi:hypothetical protein
MVSGFGVATGTGRWSSLENATAVAGVADLALVSAGQGERGLVMVERGRFPGCGGMAGVATGAKRASMIVIGGMTGVTILGRALEQPRGGVTFGAECINVRAG